MGSKNVSKVRDAIATVQHLAVIGGVALAVAGFVFDYFPNVLAEAIDISRSAYVETAIIVARTTAQDAFGSDLGLHMVEVPPDRSVTHALGDVISCPDRYRPTTTWHTIPGGWPSKTAIYGLNTSLLPSGEVQIQMRASVEIGHIFLGVHVRCEERLPVFALSRERALGER